MSAEPTTVALDYTVNRRDYFWHWREAGEVVEWRNGSTIAFREEIEEVLAALAPDGLPPFGAILLVLAACHDSWHQGSAEVGLLRGLADQAAAQASELATHEQFDAERMLSHFDRLLTRVIQGLDVIGMLPSPLRSGLRAKSQLLATIFEGVPGKLPRTESAMALDVFREHAEHGWLHQRSLFEPLYRQLEMDLRSVQTATEELRPGALMNRLATGLDEPIEPAPVPVPEPQPMSLLDQLSADPETAPIAHLARHLMAVLHLPRHSTGTGDLPLGGFADLSNRGTPDRLLLTELAQDDLTLAVRVANGEALYLRREAPPAPPHRERVVLLDHGIRLWGLPRLFATAVALAFSHDQRQLPTRVLSHRQGRFEPADLTTANGVGEELRKLDAAPHPGVALAGYVGANPTALTDTEHVLVTHDAVLADPDFRRVLGELPAPPSFLVAVNREGGLRLFSMGPSGQRQLTKMQLDLQRMLGSSTDAASIRATNAPGDLPRIFGLPKFPLRLPAALHRASLRVKLTEAYGLVGVTSDRRLLHWTEAGRGGRQLTDQVPVSYTYMIAVNEAGDVALLAVHTRDGAYLIRTHLYGDRPTDSIRLPLPDKLSYSHLYLSAEWLLVFTTDRGIYAIDWTSGRVADHTDYPDGSFRWMDNVLISGGKLCTAAYNGRSFVFYRHEEDAPHGNPEELDRQRCQRFIRAPCALMNKFQAVGVTQPGNLALIGANGRIWEFTCHEDHLRLRDLPSEHLSPEGQQRFPVRYQKQFEAVDGPEGVGYNLQRVTWTSGSTVWLDSRGLLHLRSHLPELPEMTLVLAHRKPVSAWLSDGRQCGQPAFIDPHLAATAQPLDVYLLLRKFLQGVP